MSATGLGDRQQTATNPPPDTDLEPVGNGAGDKVIIAPSKTVTQTCAQFPETGLLTIYPHQSRVALLRKMFTFWLFSGEIRTFLSIAQVGVTRDKVVASRGH